MIISQDPCIHFLYHSILWCFLIDRLFSMDSCIFCIMALESQSGNIEKCSHGHFNTDYNLMAFGPLLFDIWS